MFGGAEVWVGSKAVGGPECSAPLSRGRSVAWVLDEWFLLLRV